MRPLVDKLVELTAPFNLSRSQHPNGRMIQIKLLPLIGDLGATHKIAGYASHSANHFCSWCNVHRDNREKLKLGKSRTAANVHRLLKAGWRMILSKVGKPSYNKLVLDWRGSSFFWSLSRSLGRVFDGLESLQAVMKHFQRPGEPPGLQEAFSTAWRGSSSSGCNSDEPEAATARRKASPTSWSFSSLHVGSSLVPIIFGDQGGPLL
ncbi:hypothetical protein PSTG_06717 [Puccinia striiformis f. sp. tritici PST-78]|uniref:Uncharacterized protein n=1 Tax=Puccinia striiformis f. sp. tritici PST-78 TaxID=1165861 RepID=A0A0L0VLF4_9BASI|nr:hypothetical protein PSTG_06717 [Puccinia striiformis f. sp. tritici PST-78]